MRIPPLALLTKMLRIIPSNRYDGFTTPSDQKVNIFPAYLKVKPTLLTEHGAYRQKYHAGTPLTSRTDRRVSRIAMDRQSFGSTQSNSAEKARLAP